jgi:hypothetical protein
MGEPVLGQVLDENGVFLIENMSWNCSISYESIIRNKMMR